MDYVLALALLAFGLSWWLGLYLLGRDPADLQLRYSGLGLVIYALALAADSLSQNAPEPGSSATLIRWGWPLLFLPALFWFGSLIYFLPEEAAARRRLGRLFQVALIPGAFLLYLLAAGTQLIVVVTPGGPRPGPLFTLFAAIIVIELFAALLLVGRAMRTEQPRRGLGLILAATIFFALGIGLLIIPFDFLPRWLLLLAIGVDLAVLGTVIAVLDAFAQGEAFLPDFFRSLVFSLFAVIVFAGQVTLAIVLSTGPTFPMLVLLLATIAAAIALQIFADPIQSGLDWLVFRRIPRIRQTRADLRAVASAAPKSRETLDPAELTPAQFSRLTRRALSQMGNLPHLAASPLTRLALIEERLDERGAADNTLERAAELKALLTESIEQLKPRNQGDFGTADEWRHYNALYYPYVAGLKPYSRRASHFDLNGSEKEALDWFRAQVPERTLYNWQNAAAKLVAQDLRERSRNGR